MIKLREGEITVKDAYHLGEYSEPIMNLAVQMDDKERTLFHNLFFNDDTLLLPGSDAVKNIGKPNVIVRDFESSPGLWVLDDEETEITFLIWSDGYKKQPWKGTSYEAILKDGDASHLYKAFERLIDYLCLEDQHPSEDDSPNLK